VNFPAGDGGEIRVISRPVSDNYFSVLGIKPFLGRMFVDGDDRADPPVAVMTYACWNRLGSDPDIVGRQIAQHTIVGVAPREFTGSLYGLDGGGAARVNPAGERAFASRPANLIR
jgi:hypothetical protein